MKRTSALALLFMLLSLILAACTPSFGDTSPVAIPLPKPVDGTYPLNVLFRKVDGGMTMDLSSPIFESTYGEQGDDVGKVVDEKVEFRGGAVANMMKVAYGDYRKGKVELADYYEPNGSGKQLGGVIELSVKDGSIFQWLTGNFRYTVARSKLDLVFQVQQSGQRPQLTQVLYKEIWGLGGSEWAMGRTMLWTDMSVIPEQYHTWGFWESDLSPFTIVTQAIDAVDARMRDIKADIEIVDEDSLSEILGRQTAFRVKHKGQQWGDIQIEYSNIWGRQPNTDYIGTGALSRVDFNLGDKYYGLVLVTPKGYWRGNSIYILTDDKATADRFQKNAWFPMYDELRKANPHVLLAVWELGDIGDISRTVSTGDSSDTVKLGSQGGLSFVSINNPTHEQVVEAHNVLSYLGESGLKALGLYFPTDTKEGSGFNYYVSTLVLATSDRKLAAWGTDVGVIDRVGYPHPFGWEAVDK